MSSEEALKIQLKESSTKMSLIRAYRLEFFNLLQILADFAEKLIDGCKKKENRRQK